MPAQPKATSGFSAEEIVGWNYPSDNRSMHAEEFVAKHIAPLRCFGPDADPLVACLENKTIRSAVDGYRTPDKGAGASQHLYLAQSQRIQLPTFIAFGVCLLLLIPPSTIAAEALRLLDSAARFANLAVINRDFAQTIEGFVRAGLPRLIFVMLLGSLFLAWFYRPERHYGAWHTQRADAEAMRREIFARLMNAVPAGMKSDNPWLLQLKLEYFRRWQVEVQNAYFQKRPKELRKHVKWARVAKAAYLAALVCFALVLVASCVASIDEQGISPLAGRFDSALSYAAMVETANTDYWLLLVLSVTVIVGLLLVYKSTLANALRQAARYENMQQNFELILGDRLVQARIAAEAGNEKGVRQYVERMHAMMSLELNDWARLQMLETGLDFIAFDSEPAIAGAKTSSQVN